jgi:hypothetical protein
MQPLAQQELGRMQRPLEADSQDDPLGNECFCCQWLD